VKLSETKKGAGRGREAPEARNGPKMSQPSNEEGVYPSDREEEESAWRRKEKGGPGFPISQERKEHRKFRRKGEHNRKQV